MYVCTATALHSALCSVGKRRERSQQSRRDPAIIFPKATQPTGSVFSDSYTSNALLRLAMLENSRNFLNRPHAAPRSGCGVPDPRPPRCSWGAAVLAAAVSPGTRAGLELQKRGMRHCCLAAPSAPGWGHSAPWLSLPTPWRTESRPEQPPGADVPGLPSHLCLCNFY